MSNIPVTLWFMFNEKRSLDIGEITDRSQIQYFEFEEWKEHPPQKFLNVGSKFKFESQAYEITEIITNLNIMPYENVSGSEIGSNSYLTVIYYIKEV